MSANYPTIDYLICLTIWLLLGVGSFVILVVNLRGSRSRPRRLLVQKIGFAIWFFLAAFTGVELYFAFIYDTTDSFNMTNVSKKWFDKHVVRDQQILAFDSIPEVWKYRDDRELPESYDEDQHLICFLGDSFTFGHGVPNVADRFSNRVRNNLDQKQPGRFLVSNLSNTGIGLILNRKMLEVLFENGHKIDTVVYVLCLNDIEEFDIVKDREFLKKLGSVHPKFFLWRDTYFLNLVYFRVQQASRPELKDYYSFVNEFYDGRPFQLMRSEIKELNSLCKENNSQLRLVIFPFLHNLGDDYPFKKAHSQISEACREMEIPTFDLLPVLSKREPTELTVNRLDAHPNELAHKLAAEAIEQELLKDLLGVD